MGLKCIVLLALLSFSAASHADIASLRDQPASVLLSHIKFSAQRLEGKDLTWKHLRAYVSKLFHVEYRDSLLEDETELLESYNVLRQREKLSEVNSIDDIDQSWLKLMRYKEYRELHEFLLNPERSGAEDNIRLLLRRIPDSYQNILNNEDALFSYNLLRESQGRVPVWSLEQMQDGLLESMERSVCDARRVKEQDDSLDSLLYYIRSDVRNFSAAKSHRDLLCSYNLLRERLSPPLPAAKEIDQDWLASLMTGSANEKDKDKSNSELAMQILEDVSLHREHGLSKTDTKNRLELAAESHFNAYNLLRQRNCLATVKSAEEIDYPWVASFLTPEIVDQLFYGRQGDEPTEGQKRMVDRALEYLGFKGKIKLVRSYREGASTHLGGSDVPVIHYFSELQGMKANDTALVTLDANPERNRMLFYFHHEMGHAINEDVRSLTKITKGFSSIAIEQAKIKGVLDRVDRLEALGRKAIGQSTEIGKEMSFILARHVIFWKPPKDKREYERTLLGRTMEIRADLFAADKLWGIGEIDPILQIIVSWGGDGYIVVEGNRDEHPSSFERALYLVGFLADKGVNVNAELERFENNPTCYSIENE
jgi:hypothetical protein